MREVFTIVLVIIGALIGAGFASGQEIYSFFYSYGIIGLVGIFITCILISVTIYKSFKIIFIYLFNSNSLQSSLMSAKVVLMHLLTK